MATLNALVGQWKNRAKAAHPSDAMLLNLCIRELEEHLAAQQADTKRLDWLCRQFVTVRIPLRYGSETCFMGSPADDDGDLVPWDLRAAIDAVKGGA